MKEELSTWAGEMLTPTLGPENAQLLKSVWSPLSLSSSVVPKAGTRTQHPRLARTCPLSLGTLLLLACALPHSALPVLT